MKTKNIIVIAISFLMTLFVSCTDSWPYSENEYNNIYINVYPSYISLDEDDLNGEFTVSSSGSWYIYSTPSWIQTDKSNGLRYDDVAFTATENEGSYKRSGTIRIRTNTFIEKEATIEIRQEPTNIFDASMPITDYVADGDWWHLNVKAATSKNWTISKSVSWVHFGNSSNSSYSYNGRGDEKVKIYVDKNTYSYSRNTVLTVKCGNKSKTITITQQGASSKARFVINSVEIGNVDYEWNVINDYGRNIYSYQTRYLTPKINITVYTPGTYSIYVKLYNPNGSLMTGNSSPSGYTYKNDVTLYSNTTYYKLSGWGSNTPGHYSSGQYRFEFYYNGEKIGEKSFRIY